MIRAAAKNHDGVAVVVKPESYDAVPRGADQSGGEISAETRHWLANEAFAHTAAYDAAIRAGSGPATRPTRATGNGPRQVPRALLRREPAPEGGVLRRGRGRARTCSRGSPSSTAGRSRSTTCSTSTGAAAAERVRQPACVIIKHNNPCGVATSDPERVIREGVRGGPAVGLRRRHRLQPPVDAALAVRLHEQFIEVLLAPGFDDDALLDPDLEASDAAPRPRSSAATTHARIRPEAGPRGAFSSRTRTRSRRPVTGDRRDPPPARRGRVARHRVRLDGLQGVKSNAIVFARDGATLGIGAGRMSRLDSVRIALDKAGDASATVRPGCSPARRRLRRILPVRRRPREGDRRRRAQLDPARRLEARRRDPGRL